MLIMLTTNPCKTVMKRPRTTMPRTTITVKTMAMQSRLVWEMMKARKSHSPNTRVNHWSHQGSKLQTSLIDLFQSYYWDVTKPECLT